MCLEDKIPGCGLITSSLELCHGQDKQLGGKGQCQQDLPRTQKALQDCQDVHCLLLHSPGPCPTSKQLWIIWEARMMAHPCGNKQRVFHLTMDESCTTVNADLGMDTAMAESS